MPPEENVNDEENLEELLNEEGEELTNEEEEAEFASEFGEEADEYEPVAEKEELEDVSDKTETEDPKKEDAPDPLSEAMATIGALNDRLRKTEGRYGELNSKFNEISEARKNEPPVGHPSREEVLAAIKDPDKLDNLRERFPVWSDDYDTQEAINTARLGTNEFATKDDLAEFAKADSMQGYVSTEQMSAIIAKERQLTLLEVRHPRWEQTVESKDFKGWLEKQDESAVKLYNSDSAADAIELLDVYSNDVNEVKKARDKKDRLKKAVPATTGSRSVTEKGTSEEDEFLAEFKR